MMLRKDHHHGVAVGHFAAQSLVVDERTVRLNWTTSQSLR